MNAIMPLDTELCILVFPTVVLSALQKHAIAQIEQFS